VSRVDELKPDQRAALQLLLKQGRSYEEIASLLRIDPSAVRERARSALDALGPEDVDGLELAQQDEIADYLLGQQSASGRAATRDLLERSAPGRAWARVVAGELRSLAPDALPDIPAEAAEVDEAFGALQARTEHRERTERSSKVGGAILLGALALAVAVVLALVLSGGDDDEEGERAATQTSPAQTQTQGQQGQGQGQGQQAGQPKIEDQINLTPPEGAGGKAAGVAQVASQNGQRAVALVAQGVPSASRQPPRFYALWLYESAEKAKFLGFPDPQPDQQGRIETGFPLPKDAAEYGQIVVTEETQEKPASPGKIILSGNFKQG
jgi:hypothetical protein